MQPQHWFVLAVAFVAGYFASRFFPQAAQALGCP